MLRQPGHTAFFRTALFRPALASAVRIRGAVLALMAAGLGAGNTAQAQSQGAYGPLTLVYHQVGVKSGITQSIRPEDLRQRIATLHALGYRVVTSSQASRAAPGQRLAVIQFDDGFASVYQHAFPVLRDLGVPGTAFVIWSKVGQPGFMTLPQLQELQAAGWEIGSHTQTHAALTDLTPAGVRRELAAGPLGGVNCVSYPLNRHDTRVRRVVRALGVTCGVGGGPVGLGLSDAEALPAPAITPWDGNLLPSRAHYGLDMRVPLVLTGLGTALLEGWKGQNPRVGPPLMWNPAHHELLGNGAFSLTWRGGESRDLRLDIREGRWNVHTIFRRGADGLHGHYNAFSVGYQWGRASATPLTLALGLDSGGPLVGAALGLNGYGEVWGRASQMAGNWTWALGGSVIPADYWLVYGAFSPRAAQLGLRTALPWNGGEARPLRLGGGYRWGKVNAAYIDAEYRLGSYAVSAEVDTRRNFGIKFSGVW